MTVTVKEIGSCGFCSTGHHENCSISVKHEGRHEKYKNGIVWTCGCTCNTGRRKCAHCGNRITDEVDPATFECLDIEACHALVIKRWEENPFHHQLRDIKERVNMAKIENDKAKAEKAEKAKEPTYCLVTGEPTKGGLFKPGMDARYVSERVIEVENAKFTAKAKQAALAKMKKDGVSERLVAKFEKSVGLAQTKAEAKEAAKAEKEKAKAEKATASAS